MMLLGRACAIVLLLGCAALHAQQAPPPPPPPPPPAGPPSQPPAPAPAPASLSGRVVAADTGSPVRSADVRLAATDQNPNDRNPKASTVVARTDDEGRFELESLPAGSYSLQVVKAGFVSTTFGLSKDQPGNFGLSAGPDGMVDAADWSALAAAVPESGAAGALACASILLGRRARRRARPPLEVG